METTQVTIHKFGVCRIKSWELLLQTLSVLDRLFANFFSREPHKINGYKDTCACLSVCFVPKITTGGREKI